MADEPRNATIAVDSITVNLARLVRAGTDAADVDEYARLDKEGVELPRIDVFKKPDTSPVEYILVDGDVRLEAWRKNGKKEVPVRVFDGTPGDAVLAAASANALHGRPRSAADKRKAIRLLLEQPEHAKKTSRELARLAGGLSHHLVEEVREDMGKKDEKRVNKRGKTVTAKKRRKKAAVLFDFTEVLKSIGNSLKATDDVVEVYPDEKKSGDYRLVKQAGDKFFELFQAWSKRLAKIKPA